MTFTKNLTSIAPEVPVFGFSLQQLEQRLQRFVAAVFTFNLVTLCVATVAGHQPVLDNLMIGSVSLMFSLIGLMVALWSFMTSRKWQLYRTVRGVDGESSDLLYRLARRWVPSEHSQFLHQAINNLRMSGDKIERHPYLDRLGYDDWTAIRDKELVELKAHRQQIRGADALMNRLVRDWGETQLYRLSQLVAAQAAVGSLRFERMATRLGDLRERWQVIDLTATNQIKDLAQDILVAVREAESWTDTTTATEFAH